MVESGKDFGSGSVQFLKTPKLAIVGGSGVSQTHFGETWHYFDQTIQFPTTVLNYRLSEASGFIKIRCADFAFWELRQLSKSQLADFVNNGGKLIMLDNAIKHFERKFADSEKRGKK